MGPGAALSAGPDRRNHALQFSVEPSGPPIGSGDCRRMPDGAEASTTNAVKRFANGRNYPAGGLARWRIECSAAFYRRRRSSRERRPLEDDQLHRKRAGWVADQKEFG